MDRVFEDAHKESHYEQLRCRQFITEILEIAKLLVNATRRGRVTGQCYEEDEIVLR